MARKAYFTIDQTTDDGSPVYRVWRRRGDESIAEMIGEFGTLEEAKAAFPVRWREGLHLTQAWGWGPLGRSAAIRQVTGRSGQGAAPADAQTGGRDETTAANY